jgi:AcrR family transcriptional regulator
MPPSSPDQPPAGTNLISRPVRRTASSLSPRALPTQARGEKTRASVICASHLVLKSAGLAGLTTQAVAEAAGVSIGTVYRLFPNKEAIICALYQEKLEQIRSIAERKAGSLTNPATWRRDLTLFLASLKAAEKEVDLDPALVNAIHLLPALWEVDVRHAVSLADRIVELLRGLGSTWSDAALFDLAMTLYSLDATSWMYARIVGHMHDLTIQRLVQASISLIEPALSGAAEPEVLGVDRRQVILRNLGADMAEAV